MVNIFFYKCLKAKMKEEERLRSNLVDHRRLKDCKQHQGSKEKISVIYGMVNTKSSIINHVCVI